MLLAGPGCRWRTVGWPSQGASTDPPYQAPKWATGREGAAIQHGNQCSPTPPQPNVGPWGLANDAPDLAPRVDPIVCCCNRRGEGVTAHQLASQRRPPRTQPNARGEGLACRFGPRGGRIWPASTTPQRVGMIDAVQPETTPATASPATCLLDLVPRGQIRPTVAIPNRRRGWSGKVNGARRGRGRVRMGTIFCARRRPPPPPCMRGKR